MPTKRKNNSKNISRFLVVVTLLLALGLVAIIVKHHLTRPVVKHSIPAKSVPSESATMICTTKEVKDEVAQATGVTAVRISTPTWDAANHLYSCDYLYENGAKITFLMKEMSSATETTAYFTSLGNQRGRNQELAIGQGAYSTNNGSVVVRKDYKVLLVDVSHLPELFGAPTASSPSLSTRGDAAVNIAIAILNCWSGA